MAKKKKEPIFKITQYQPNNEVTCSSILVEVGGLKILLDLGLLQNSSDTFPQLYHKNMQKLKSIPYDELDYCIFCHAHFDHVAGLGVLGRKDSGFHGILISTELTTQLAKINKEDAYKINLKDVCKYNNIKDKKKKDYETYYDKDDIQRVIDNTHCYGYNEKIKLNDKVTVELLPACHLQGASMCYITYTDEYTTKHLLYTSDITYAQKVNRPFTMNIQDKKSLKVDYLIMESTYGLRDRIIPKEENPMGFLEKYILEEVVHNNRILFIPSFAIGRATTLYYYLYKIFERNEEIKKANIPVYFCGGMMKEAHNIIGKPSSFDYYDKEWQNEQDIWYKEPFAFLQDQKDIESICFNNSRKIGNYIKLWV